MSEMVDRVGYAACDAGRISEHPINSNEWWRDVARAALAEMREPTEAMIKASSESLRREVEATPEPRPWQLMKLGGYRFPTAFKARVRWRAMVDEALR